MQSVMMSLDGFEMGWHNVMKVQQHCTCERWKQQKECASLSSLWDIPEVTSEPQWETVCWNRQGFGLIQQGSSMEKALHKYVALKKRKEDAYNKFTG